MVCRADTKQFDNCYLDIEGPTLMAESVGLSAELRTLLYYRPLPCAFSQTAVGNNYLKELEMIKDEVYCRYLNRERSIMNASGKFK